MIRRIVRVVVVAAALAAAGTILAIIVPRSRERSRSRYLRADPHRVYEAILDSEGMTAWRSDVREVHTRRNRKKWIEVLRGNIEVEYQVTRTVPDELVEMAFYSDLGFSGRLMIEMVEHEAGTNITITENTSYDRWIAGALACLVNLFELGIDRYLTDLKSYLEGDEEDTDEEDEENDAEEQDDEEEEEDDEEEEDEDESEAEEEAEEAKEQKPRRKRRSRR
ncbi:MAG TPA: SRPBCC domain-containing protein [Dongiaceae bacterium]|jgi:uncharacterized protein YndB with AHSA1/START domain|nr:SRPBCC domain-containing protein [Dongiaceae bacterium]